ncbi:Uncharacterized protein QTN25_003279 [Entamoeba marina]
MLIPSRFYKEYQQLKELNQKEPFCFIQLVQSSPKTPVLFCGHVNGVSPDNNIHIEHDTFPSKKQVIFAFGELEPISAFVVSPLDVEFEYVMNFSKQMEGLLQKVKCAYRGMILKLMTPTPFGFKKVRICVTEVNNKGMGYFDGNIYSLSIHRIFSPIKCNEEINRMKKNLLTNGNALTRCEYCKKEIKFSSIEQHITKDCEFRLKQCDGCHLLYNRCHTKQHHENCISYQLLDDISGFVVEAEQKFERFIVLFPNKDFEYIQELNPGIDGFFENCNVEEKLFDMEAFGCIQKRYHDLIKKTYETVVDGSNNLDNVTSLSDEALVKYLEVSHSTSSSQDSLDHTETLTFELSDDILSLAKTNDISTSN